MNQKRIEVPTTQVRVGEAGSTAFSARLLSASGALSSDKIDFAPINPAIVTYDPDKGEIVGLRPGYTSIKASAPGAATVMINVEVVAKAAVVPPPVASSPVEDEDG